VPWKAKELTPPTKEVTDERQGGGVCKKYMSLVDMEAVKRIAATTWEFTERM